MDKVILDRFTALGHEPRMAVFRLLARRFPDAVPAGEIARALDIKPNTLSVYLSTLSQVGLVGQTRIGTSLQYRVNWDAAQEVIDFLFLDCCRGRPDLCPPAISSHIRERSQMTDNNLKILFICSGNSARSIFAETILRDAAGDRFEVYSVGTRPASELNTFAVELLRSKGHDVSPLRAKHISEFQGDDAPVMDFVFTVCDQAANEECPAWAGQPVTAHWGVPDPVQAQGTDAEKRLAFQQAYGILKNRISLFTALRPDALDRVVLQASIDEISQQGELA
ncbi:MAG: helix-turn-helix domain-containing protein [Marinosulfonomonas sp.]